MTLAQLAEKYENLILEKKRNSDRDATLSTELQQVEAELLEELGLSGIESLKTTGGTTLYRRVDRIVTKKSGVSSEDLCHELAQHELTRDLVSPNYNSRSLSSRWREILESDDPVPERLAQMLTVFEKPRIGYRT